MKERPSDASRYFSDVLGTRPVLRYNRCLLTLRRAQLLTISLACRSRRGTACGISATQQGVQQQRRGGGPGICFMSKGEEGEGVGGARLLTRWTGR